MKKIYLNDLYVIRKLNSEIVSINDVADMVNLSPPAIYKIVERMEGKFDCTLYARNDKTLDEKSREIINKICGLDWEVLESLLVEVEFDL